jgi:hypothetical protein
VLSLPSYLHRPLENKLGTKSNYLLSAVSVLANPQDRIASGAIILCNSCHRHALMRVPGQPFAYG